MNFNDFLMDLFFRMPFPLYSAPGMDSMELIGLVQPAIVLCLGIFLIQNRAIGYKTPFKDWRFWLMFTGMEALAAWAYFDPSYHDVFTGHMVSRIFVAAVSLAYIGTTILATFFKLYSSTFELKIYALWHVIAVAIVLVFGLYASAIVLLLTIATFLFFGFSPQPSTDVIDSTIAPETAASEGDTPDASSTEHL